MQDTKKHLIFTVIAILVLAADQLTKWLILRELEVQTAVSVIPGFLNIVHVQNPGGAFGIFASQNGMFRAFVFVIIALVAVGLVFYLHYRTPPEYRFLTVGFSLIFSGALGNLIDRFRFGKVIDFIDIYAGQWHWPAFNVADSAITVGMIIFAWYLVVKKMPE